MTPETVIDVLRRALEMGGIVAGPILLVALFIGVVVSILQATTQINDMALVFIPKILGAVLVISFFGSWMIQMYVDFTRQMLLSLPLMMR